MELKPEEIERIKAEEKCRLEARKDLADGRCQGGCSRGVHCKCHRGGLLLGVLLGIFLCWLVGLFCPRGDYGARCWPGHWNRPDTQYGAPDNGQGHPAVAAPGPGAAQNQ